MKNNNRILLIILAVILIVRVYYVYSVKKTNGKLIKVNCKDCPNYKNQMPMLSNSNPTGSITTTKFIQKCIDNGCTQVVS